MRVAVLGIRFSPLSSILRGFGCWVIEYEAPIDIVQLEAHSIDFAVSYRYRHIVQKPVIDYLKDHIINLHISFLPWNRGADPNLWSFLEDTPRGVTIHYIDEGIDTGDIIAQREVAFPAAGETLRFTYDRLNDEIVALFKEQWPLIMRGEASRQKQPPGGSFHRTTDKRPYEGLLAERGWDTRIEVVTGKALRDSGA